MTVELDWRTGDMYIDSAGKVNIIEELAAVRQSIRNMLMTWEGTENGSLMFGVDWKRIMTVAGTEDASPYITVELTRVLTPAYEPRIDRLTAVNVNQTTQNGRRGYTVYTRIMTVYAKEIEISELIFP